MTDNEDTAESWDASMDIELNSKWTVKKMFLDPSDHTLKVKGPGEVCWLVWGVYTYHAHFPDHQKRMAENIAADHNKVLELEGRIPKPE